jgi:CDGSH-type Zn-finger protein
MKNIKRKIKVAKDGPYRISGGLALSKEIIVADENGDSIGYRKGQRFDSGPEYALCRCGWSKNKPFCDGSHASGFEGEETASFEKFQNHCDKITGPEVDLYDLPELCALTRFCHDRKSDVWTNAEESDDPVSKKEAIRQSCLCTSGRLAAFNKKTGDPIELELEQEISLIEDPERKVSGPIWVKGGIEVESAAGRLYEVRNRVTLCRCGKSQNKPFCDGRHIEEKFNDGDESLS